MQFRNTEEKVIYEKLLRGSLAFRSQKNPGTFAQDVPPLLYPDIFPEEQTKARFFRVLEERKAMRQWGKISESQGALTDHSGVLGKGLGFLRRVVRKLFLRWYVLPMAERQTRFNQAALEAVDELYEMHLRMVQGMAEQEILLAEQTERIRLLSMKLEESEKERESE